MLFLLFKLFIKVLLFLGTAAIPDVLDFIVLLIAIYGMYEGIEIRHPVYALLFTNLIFSFVATSINLLAFLVFPFNIWTRIFLYGNLFSTHFHVTSWSIISILRYLYIEHKDWIERRWPNPINLTSTALVAQFSCFGAVMFVDLGLLVVFATPYGWPSKGFIEHVPQNVRLFIVSCWAILFTLLVVVTGIFYVLLVCSRLSPLTSNKISTEAEVDKSKSKQEKLNLECYDELERGQIESESPLQDQLQSESAGTSFAYNVILKQSGQQHKEGSELFVCHEYFGVKNNGDECSTINSSCFQNASDNIEIFERETKNTTSGQQEPNLIHVREADPVLRISAQQLTDQFNLHSRNETSNISANFDFDDIMVDPTFQVSNNCTTENEMNNPSTNDNRSNKSGANSIIFTKNLAINRQEAERMSALRSLKTNLIMILLLSMSMMILLIPSTTWQAYFCVVITSIQKGLLPIVTTMANFGTVRTVAAQFWKTFVETKLLSST
jgi:hypothetical protein